MSRLRPLLKMSATPNAVHSEVGRIQKCERQIARLMERLDKLEASDPANGEMRYSGGTFPPITKFNLSEPFVGVTTTTFDNSRPDGPGTITDKRKPGRPRKAS